MIWRKQENKNPRESDDGYVTIKLSKELVESCGRVVRILLKRSAPFLVGLVVGGSGMAGVANWLVVQPDASVVPMVEEQCPGEIASI